ncbi:hypothetical protein PsorP6_003565 [Peronosclerospora sorghi]|uniref:Uncharacterized protein n=1 Tax=Peronosclerospora sorghi TaxID=230839 RepID=A0ACC0VMG5_9STRA|nr:hypothetical protein PsorP6_003565 [Peronosclerospora sorghi]
MTISMRLRAPDEPEAESGCNVNAEVDISSHTTSDRSHFLPPLDVRSSEFIEERLENLKRRPKWVDFLNQYVKEHPDSDSETDVSDFDEVSIFNSPGMIRSTLWSLFVVAVSPLLIVCAPFLKHKDYGFCPLGCRSIKELLWCALLNMSFMVFGLLLLYWAICRELPDVFYPDKTLVKLNVQIDEMLHAMDLCRAALLQWERAVAQKLCVPIGIDVALVLVNTCLLLNYHRQLVRYLMVLMAVMFVMDLPSKLYDITFPSPEITKVDPTFALLDEELVVAFEGKNMRQGGSVGWVSYWGCASTSNVEACEKQFVSTFEAGNVAVTFRSLDHFIPCYQEPPNPLKAQDYQCFEHVRIRVRSKRSIPGWSRLATQSSLFSQSEHAVLSPSDGRGNRVEMSSFEQNRKLLSDKIDHDRISPTSSKQKIEISTVSTLTTKIGNSALSSSEYLTTKTSRPSELKNKASDVSTEEDARGKLSLSSNFLEHEQENGIPEASNIAATVAVEIEVAPHAEVKMSPANREVSNEGKEYTLSSDSHMLSSSKDVVFDKARSKVEVLPADSPDEKLEKHIVCTSMMEPFILTNKRTQSRDELTIDPEVIEKGDKD